MIHKHKKAFTTLLFAFCMVLTSAFRIDAAVITDDAGQELAFNAAPERVISLLPSASDVLRSIGAANSLAGVTYQDMNFEEMADKTVIGGSDTPQFAIIKELSPDLMIVAQSDFQKAKDSGINCRILAINDNTSIEEAESRMRMLGEIFGRQGETERVIADNHELMNTIRRKVDKIPEERRKRVMYLTMGTNSPMTTGDKSFQSGIIRAAGGITGSFGDDDFIPVTLSLWLEFNPDSVYVTNAEYANVREFLNLPGWCDVPAVKNNQIFSFPGALIDNRAVYFGYFASWLSAEIYLDEFMEKDKLVYPQEVISERGISLDIPYVERARIIESRMYDSVHRTLVIDFDKPQHIISTTAGERSGIMSVANSYSPVTVWSIYHKLGFERSLDDLFGVLNLDRNKTEIMATGADMNNVVIKTASYRDMKVTAVVTAGVESNALRTSKDTGAWYEPGTINILLMTNHKLSEQGAARAIITATEAKTAALWDMDIRSSQNRAFFPATGTGTDSVIIVSGEGVVLNGSGGHTKMGELIADAVYRGVQEALLKQNGKKPIRNTILRLKERGLSTKTIAGDYQLELEELLISPVHKNIQGFLESAFSISDAQVMGQISNFDMFNLCALTIAEIIAGCPVALIESFVPSENPPVLITALDALLTGLKYRRERLAPPTQTPGNDISLLTIDSDSYVAHQAVSGIELPDGIKAGAFCLSDLERREAAQFVKNSSVIVVDVMDDNLVRYVEDNGLFNGRTVFALRSSKDDSFLAEKGFVFDDKVNEYYDYLDMSNIRNMLKRALSITSNLEIPHEPVVKTTENGLYHPDDGGKTFERAEDYLKWYTERNDYDPRRPTLGLMFFSSSLVEGQREAFDELIVKLEQGGFNLLPAFGRDQILMDSIFLDSNRAPRVDAILSFSLKFYMSINEKLRGSIAELDVPVFNAVNLYSISIDEWAASEAGIPPVDVVWTMATPEISGAIEPTPLMGKVEERRADGGTSYRYQLIPGMTERIIPRIHNWIKLREIKNADKKVAILYYNNSRGKQSISASYLNVFRSLESITEAMKESGYSIPDDAVLNEEEIKSLVLRGGRNVGSWAPGELEDLISSGQVVLLPIEEYKSWFAALPEDFRLRVLEQWGEPEKSDLMIRDGNIIIPLVRAGNVIMLPEPARGAVDDPLKLYHDPVLYPHHQYIAVYLWLKYGYGADAMVHLGTHSTYEWLPGKSAGLSLSCPTEVMITDIPNTYIYIMDNVGEGIQAKRRGRGVIIDHLAPPLVSVAGYNEYAELKDLCSEYEGALSFGANTAGTYLSRVKELALRIGIDKDLGLEGINNHEDVAGISQYLEYLETQTVPYGLHTFGASPEGDSLQALAQAIMEQNPDLNKNELIDNLRKSGPEEMRNFLRSLEGHYVPPAEGNDPVRNPGALPTGRNFYGISPNRLPTSAAWELGKKAAQEIIDNYVDENKSYPDKVAVILWAVESLRNEGLNEATILALIGVEPIWASNGEVAGTKPIPAAVLKRPRVDVTVNASGLYRDIFPEKILFLDAAIRQAAAQDDIENFIAKNDKRIESSLINSGMNAEEAGRFSRARIFSEAPGAYGNRVDEMVSASGLWEKDSDIADVYRKHTGFAYGSDTWGAPAKQALEENLRDAKVAFNSVSSNYYGMMDNDDMFVYLGGLSLAIRDLTGSAPQTFLADQRTLGSVRMESLQKMIGAEMRSRYLNPKWVEGMKAENYAGGVEMSHYLEYLWGWQVTAPDAVDETAWNETYEVYVEDKYGLEIEEFLNKENPWAYQSMTARMLETTRKGYWDASDEIKQRLALNYAASVLEYGLACCDHTCNNPQLHQVVMNLISIPGLMSPELVAEFKLAVEKAGQSSLEEMVETRMEMLKNIGNEPQKPNEMERVSQSGPESQSVEESVKGFKMEKVEESPEKTSISSSGVEWFASFFVLAILALFYTGFRAGTRKPKGYNG